MSNIALYKSIEPGDYVTYAVKLPHWREAQSRRGRAIFEGPSGWVLNLGRSGGYQPGIANPDNVTKVTKPKKKNDNFTKTARVIHGFPGPAQRLSDNWESQYDGG